jgi:radical SAM protein with 4Fe4S-binding SPASM domain
MEGKQVTLISNGTKGKAKDYNQLIKLGVGLFEFPIHSAQAGIHDTMVQLKGSWQKSVTSTREVLKLGGSVVPVVVITKHNVNQLGETLRFIASLGCKRIMLNRYNIGGKGCNNPMEVSATVAELRHAFSEANTLASELDLRLTANVCSPICLLNPDDYPEIGFGHCSFDVLKRPITLDINGNIRLCNHSPVVAGNIYEKDLKEILYSDYASEWESSVPELCKPCLHWPDCKGGCRAASEQCFQTLSVEDPIIRYI